MGTSITNKKIDKLIIKTTKKFVDKDASVSNIINDIKLLLNGLKNEAIHVNNKDVLSVLDETTQLVYQNHKQEDKLIYFQYYDIFATLVELYIKIIDAKNSIYQVTS